MKIANLVGLQIDLPFKNNDAPNFKPDTWPPSNDFPVIVDSFDNVISRYGDTRWDLSPWAGRTLTINFGDGPGKGKKLSTENSSLLRQIVAWWIWGHDAVQTTANLVHKFEAIKPLLFACSNNGISATELSKFPEVIKDVASYYSSRAAKLITYLSALTYAKKELGFVILEKDDLKTLSDLLPNISSIQTAYIPVRIWSYQISRLRECLEDYLTYSKEIEECYNFCLDAYAFNAGGNLSDSFIGNKNYSPFNVSKKRNNNMVYHGEFKIIAKKFGIFKLLERWVLVNDNFRLSSFSSYLTLVSNIGLAYCLNFSLMRVEEGSRLRANCYEIELDSQGDDIHMLRGVTTKTIEDNDARWIVSPTVKIAVDAMSSVAKLRIKAAKDNPFLNLSKEDIDNPLLQSLTHEPWSSRAPKSQQTKLYKKIRSYNDIWTIWPKLFDSKELTITESDMEIANRLTYGLDSSKFFLGNTWPLAWHQLRRTGAVNMLASGMVSEASLQYQLKHANRAMSQYYGKNYYRLKEPLNINVQKYYLKEMYESIVRDFKSLQSDHYISPHGKKRKDQLISKISSKDHNQLIKAAKEGSLNYKQTFLGGCANTGPPCPLGGISNISSCMGFGDEKPCRSVILDKTKLTQILQLKEVLNMQMKGVDIESPSYESLKAQLESVERAINVIKK